MRENRQHKTIALDAPLLETIKKRATANRRSFAQEVGFLVEVALGMRSDEGDSADSPDSPPRGQGKPQGAPCGPAEETRAFGQKGQKGKRRNQRRRHRSAVAAMPTRGRSAAAPLQHRTLRWSAGSRSVGTFRPRCTVSIVRASHN